MGDESPGVLGVGTGEETMASRLDLTPSVGVSSRSVRDVRS